MSSKLMKVFILVGVLGIQTGCLKMSDDGGGGAASSVDSNTGVGTDSGKKTAGGVFNIVPTKVADVSRYLSIDFDYLKINSSTPNAGSYRHPKAALLQNARLDFPVVSGATYKVSLYKGDSLVLTEVLK
ncbi:MAG: hypothetical protein CME61_07070 [Halobacteriovoraceae bacterium]|nr:hypothetical protein [Halobacteriovoraceae bacterium]